MRYIDGNVLEQPVAEPLILRAEGTAKWHVLHVLSRQEKALSTDLAVRGIEHYLPLVRQSRFYGHRKSKVYLPLFSGYIFMLGTLEQAYTADRTGRVARIIPVFNQEQMDWELANLQMAMNRDPELTPYTFLRAGMRVEVRSGPFRGIQGVIEGRGKASRLILQVSTLGRAVSLEIDASLVEPVG